MMKLNYIEYYLALTSYMYIQVVTPVVVDEVAVTVLTSYTDIQFVIVDVYYCYSTDILTSYTYISCDVSGDMMVCIVKTYILYTHISCNRTTLQPNHTNTYNHIKCEPIQLLQLVYTYKSLDGICARVSMGAKDQ